MQAYQEEYIANLKEIAMLMAYKRSEGQSFQEYCLKQRAEQRQAEQKIKRNMELLRENLFPLLDHMPEAKKEELEELAEFAGRLLSGREELDVGLYCQIHRALLSLARQLSDRSAMIRELYYLGIGYNNLCGKLVSLEGSEAETYTNQMRLCFTEAAAYLKYYDEIKDTQTRGYILRSRANIALGRFKNASEKVRLVKQTLTILQDKDYQEKEPGLPWDRFIYMTHQQMAASISYNRENTMTSEDIADIMESVYIVYQRRLQEAAEQGEKPPIRPQYSYYTIEYYCGMDSMEGLLTKIEGLMDGADPKDYSAENMYGVISLPAFYCQFLSNYPEHIPKREEYLESLYQKILDYVEAFPEASENELLFLYLRQLSSTFVETKNSISYKDFLKNLLRRFAPKLYVHAQAVGRAAVEFCRILLEEEPDFFDDIEWIREIGDLPKKKEAVLQYAKEAALLYDIGKISFMNLYAQTARQWFEEEYEMAHLHTLVGERWLAGRPSTACYAAVAKGHHAWYDGSHGYPETYKRLSCPYRQMVDVIGLIDWLDNVTSTEWLHTGVKKTFEEAILSAVELEGRRFSPLLTVRLRDRVVTQRLEEALAEGSEAAYRHMYEENQTGKEKL